MGFKTSIATYGTDCPVGCWPAGKTPAIIYVSFSGILAGDNWVPLARFPGTSFLPLDQITGVQYYRPIHPWYCELVFNASWTELRLWHIAYGNVFYAKPLSSCVYQFDNEIITPVGNVWYGGKAQIGWATLGGSVSVQELMGLINMPPDDETYAQFWRSNPDMIVNLLARKSDASNILIRFDYS